MSVVTAVVRLPALVLMGAIRLYQLVVSPLIGPTCKYYPSCSHYGLEAVSRHGALRGTVLAAWRVLRCNPWSNGGVDEVPPVGEPLFRHHHQTSSVAT
ncbi:membrane protein insertion efficiency factor YidD [Demequina sp. TTPB684]|uniref:membrane protein insertion efficiency factor YidD n=1 Tax=unclassified Demequina TaxID=2620311 RepID=UPI001CF5F54F|nr:MULTISPECIES: membrane protein insertion efficiency factor YidD [unclassified Demequina]MCB2412664.1 membrane protein insertion efficiency factor YidD [Demequina sp. TTPB684]UPU87948.1 membrane protein insertion efficiency factor YidD [Demequina sp. TMPB413]